MSNQDDRMEIREHAAKVHDRSLLTNDPDPDCDWCGGTGWSNGRKYADALKQNLIGVTIFPCGCTQNDEQEDTST